MPARHPGQERRHHPGEQRRCRSRPSQTGSDLLRARTRAARLLKAIKGGTGRLGRVQWRQAGVHHRGRQEARHQGARRHHTEWKGQPQVKSFTTYHAVLRGPGHQHPPHRRRRARHDREARRDVLAQRSGRPAHHGEGLRRGRRHLQRRARHRHRRRRVPVLHHAVQRRLLRRHGLRQLPVPHDPLRPVPLRPRGDARLGGPGPEVEEQHALRRDDLDHVHRHVGDRDAVVDPERVRPADRPDQDQGRTCTRVRTQRTRTWADGHKASITSARSTGRPRASTAPGSTVPRPAGGFARTGDGAVPSAAMA